MGEAQMNDSDLLTAYAGGDASAFERIVAEHGGMVFAACQRVLSSRELAEEAAQATFVVLAHKARKRGTVRGSLGSFLHGVARNVALRARASELARRERERGVARAMEKRRKEEREKDWEAVGPHLDEAVEKLPRGERAAVVMHYLEGRPRAEVAEKLGVPEGTVASRLHRAVGRMRAHLEHRGTGLSAAALAGLLAESAATPACPSFLLATAGKIAVASVASTGAAAATGAGGTAVGTGVTLLAKGVLNAMFWMKIKIATAVLGTVAVVSASVPAAVHMTRAAEPSPTAEKRQPAAAPAAKEIVLKFRRLEVPRRWKSTSRGSAFIATWSGQHLAQNLGGCFEYDYSGLKAATKVHMPTAIRKWAWSFKIDFKKEMVIAFLRPHERGRLVMIKKVTVSGGAVHVRYNVGKCKGGEGRGYDVVACPCRDLPVIFHDERGRKVAEALPLTKLPLLKHRAQLYHNMAHFAVVRDREGWDRHVKEHLASPMKSGGPHAAGAVKRFLAEARVDWRREMVLVAPGWNSIKRAVVRDGVLRVEHRTRETLRENTPHDGYVLPRRDLPVVFYENGKEVGRVPFAKTEDRSLAKFLEALKYARPAGVSTVQTCEVKKERKEWHPPSWREVLLTSFERVLFGSRPPGKPYVVLHLQATPFRSETEPKPRFAKGDRILYCCDSASSKPSALKWTAAREQAVKFALAPGWEWTDRRFMCPRCRYLPFGNRAGPDRGSKCEACKGKTASDAFKRCVKCAAPKGKCQHCKRTVGPATRGVELLLGTKDPRRETDDIDPMQLAVRTGQAPSLWLAAKNKAPGGKLRELVSPTHSLQHCASLFFLVEGAGRAGTRIVCPKPAPVRKSRRPVPLTGSPVEKLTLSLRDCGGRPIFRKPGTYTVRAVAGRLISNPVTVIVSNKMITLPKVVQAPPPGVPPQLPKPVVNPPRMGPTPQWKPGGNTVAAVDGASGKMLWRVKLNFPVGSVVPGGGQWVITSVDRGSSATVDARTGRMLSKKEAMPAKKPGPPEVF